jgi:hypothetical protein
MINAYISIVLCRMSKFRGKTMTVSQRTIPPSSDTLGETLYSLRLNGLMYAQSELTAPWGIDMPPMEGKMMFHIVTQGCCWLRLLDGDTVCLKPGELALLPRGEGHLIASDDQQKGTPFFEIPVSKLSERFEFMQYGGDGEETRLTCGVLSFDHVAGQKLVSQLPQLIHMQSSNGSLPGQLQPLLQLMADEARDIGAGGETVVAHLADIIVIHAIRYWVEHAPEASKGWLGAFSEVIGTSVKQYVTEWRMSLARMKIMQSPVTLADLAEELGYQSEAAFSRAYKRVMGEPPLRQNR